MCAWCFKVDGLHQLLQTKTNSSARLVGGRGEKGECPRCSGRNCSLSHSLARSLTRLLCKTSSSSFNNFAGNGDAFCKKNLTLEVLQDLINLIHSSERREEEKRREEKRREGAVDQKGWFLSLPIVLINSMMDILLLKECAQGTPLVWCLQ